MDNAANQPQQPLTSDGQYRFGGATLGEGALHQGAMKAQVNLRPLSSDLIPSKHIVYSDGTTITTGVAAVVVVTAVVIVG